MKKIILPALALAILISCKSNDSEKDSKDEKSKQKKESSNKRGLGEDEIIKEGAYEDVEGVSDYSGTEAPADEQSGSSDDGWSKEAEDAFLENCIKEAEGNVLADVAADYCSCMLEKMERKYPNEMDVLKINSNDIMNMAGDCLDK